MPLRIDEIPSLNAQLEEVTRQMASQLPPETLQMLDAFVKELKESGMVANAVSVAISPQTPDNSLSLQEKHSLEYEVLSDVGNAVARKFGLVYSLSEPMKEFFSVVGIDLPSFNGDQSWELPIPATYVIDQSGVVVAHIDPDWTRGMEPREILEALRGLR